MSIIFVKWSEKPEIKNYATKTSDEGDVDDLPSSKRKLYSAVTVASSLFVTASLIIAGTILVKLVILII